MRFQPRIGRFLAAAADNSVSLLDIEAQVCRAKLQVGWEFTSFLIPLWHFVKYKLNGVPLTVNGIHSNSSLLHRKNDKTKSS